MKKNFQPNVDMLPNPAEAARAINEKTIPVSLRINEKTQAFFDSQAVTYGVSGNVMMSLLLDRYVDYQDNVAVKSNELNLAILQKHLERCVKIVRKLDNVTLLQNILIEGDSMAAMNGMPADLNDILRDYTAACEGEQLEDDAFDLRVWTVDAEFHCIEDDPNKLAYLYEDHDDETTTYFHDLYISPQKWPIVVYIAKNYEFKVQQLFPGEDEDQTYRRATMGKQFYRELIEIINCTTDRVELAQKIVAAYLAVQGISEELEEKIMEDNPSGAENDSEKSTIDLNSLLDGVVFPSKYSGGHAVVNNIGIIVQALEQLRGVQHFNRIVDVAQTLRLRKNPDIRIPDKYDSVISKDLQTHCSTSKNYNGKDDYFTHPEKGYWGLRPGVHTDAEGNVVVN